MLQNQGRRSWKSLGPSLVGIGIGCSPLHVFVYAVVPVANAASCQSRHSRPMHANKADARGLNDSINEERIPARLFNTCASRECKQNESPSTVLIDRIFCNVVDHVPARHTDRIPPGGIGLVAQHDNMLRDDAKSFTRFFLNLCNTVLIGGD
jgi:hypothetical protein